MKYDKNAPGRCFALASGNAQMVAPCFKPPKPVQSPDGEWV